MLNQSIENIDESQRQFLKYIKAAPLEPLKVTPKSPISINNDLAPYTTDDDYHGYVKPRTDTGLGDMK